MVATSSLRLHPLHNAFAGLGESISLPLALRRAGSTVLRRVGVGAVKAMEPLL